MLWKINEMKEIGDEEEIDNQLLTTVHFKFILW